jgi:hypothetical protein
VIFAHVMRPPFVIKMVRRASRRTLLLERGVEAPANASTFKSADEPRQGDAAGRRTGLHGLGCRALDKTRPAGTNSEELPHHKAVIEQEVLSTKASIIILLDEPPVVRPGLAPFPRR